jgi:glutamate carboxypeptidase
MTIDTLCAAVRERQPAMLDLLERSVNMESPSEDKALADEVADLFQAEFERLGFQFELDRQTEFGDNRLGKWGWDSAAPGAPRILMIGHYDTVFAAGGGWGYRVEGRHAFGPGVFDMKGGIVIGLAAVEALQAVMPGWRLPLTMILNGDEEPGSPRSRDVIRREAPKHDLCLILEPGQPGPSLTIGMKGVAIFRVVVSGREAHAGSEPEKGANSIVEMAHKAARIAALSNLEVGTSANPGVIHGGTHPYVVPGRCEMAVDFRVKSQAEQERVERALREIVAETRVPGTSAELFGHFHRPPMVSTEKTWEYIRLIQAAGDAVDYPLGTAETGGASDGNLTAAAGLPTVAGIGPHGGGAHTTGEFIELDSIPRKTEVLAVTLAALADPAFRASLGAGTLA